MTVISADWLLPVEAPPIRNGAVAYESGVITAVGKREELGSDEHHELGVIIPGLVNAQAHLEYAGYGGFGDGLPFPAWLAIHIERKRRLERADMAAQALAGAYACLAAGITTVADASYSGESAAACAEAGLRGIVYVEAFGSDPALPGLEANLDVAHAHESGRLRVGVSPHAPYTCSRAVYAAAADLGLPMTTHLAESDDERRWLLRGEGAWLDVPSSLLQPPPGTTGVRMLADHGLLGPQLLAVHCVTIDDEEVQLLSENRTPVAHCPRSNALLGCGIAPLRALLQSGVTVGLGTDSPASAISFDLFDEMRAALSAARSRERDPAALSCAEALELATLGGARALGVDHETGSLRVGKRADLAILSFAGSNFVPWDDPTAAVVLEGRPDRVVATIVDGETRYERGGRAWRGSRSSVSQARSRMLGL